jgi:hypothetical protein
VSALLVLCASFLQDAPRRPVELPPGPAAEATARLVPQAAPAALPNVADDAFATAAGWKRFGELLSAESTGGAPDPARRAELALFALAQHRYGDAWAHYAQCASSPATLAALLDRFLPGVRSSGKATVLEPALPPLRTDVALPPRGYVQQRAMRIGAFSVGGATVAMRVSVEPEGVEIDVEHASGPAVTLSIAIPEDPEFGYSDEYVDWFRQDERGVPHEVALKPGDEPHVLYARFEPRRPDWPTKEPDLVPAQLENGSILLLSGPSTEERALADAVGAFLSEGPLKIRARRADSRAAAPEPFGVAIDLTNAKERARKLAWLAGAVERRVLDRDRGRSR